MRRVQTNIDDDLYQRLHLTALIRGKSMSAVIREQLVQGLINFNAPVRRKKRRKRTGTLADFTFIGSFSSLEEARKCRKRQITIDELEFVGSIKGGEPDNISERHDEILGEGRW
jgi:hypothetical protein